MWFTEQGNQRVLKNNWAFKGKSRTSDHGTLASKWKLDLSIKPAFYHRVMIREALKPTFLLWIRHSALFTSF